MAEAIKASKNVEVKPLKDQIFPDEKSGNRLREYLVNEKLLEGNHYSAFVEQVGAQFVDKYAFLRYVTCNFAGLVSKVIADVLFGEKVTITPKDKNEDAQKFIDALVEDCELDTQLYESELNNSARGDAVLRIRVDNGKIKIEDINPAMYFPKISDNYRNTPEEVTLAWKETAKGDTYLIEETHTVGKISIKISKMKANDSKEVVSVLSVEEYNALSGKSYVEKTDTKLDEIPIIHIPNYRIKNSFWGVSDYQDIAALIFAINNRITKIDNVLDKHTDPILAVPEGVLDEEGNVEKKALGMIEVRGGEGKPEYIVWNANLESGFKEIDLLVKMIFLFSEVSPDVLGVEGAGAIESGSALKLRMLRTLAKKNRKALYYAIAIAKAIRIASKFAKTGGFKAGDVGYTGEPIKSVVKFADGVVDDKVEELTNEATKLEAGITTKKRAIMVVEDASSEEADKIIDDINAEKKDNADFNNENILHTSNQVVPFEGEPNGKNTEKSTITPPVGAKNKENDNKPTVK